PRRQRGFLLGEDAEHHHDPDESEDEDRDRVGPVATRLPADPGAEVTEPAAAFGRRRAGRGRLLRRLGGHQGALTTFTPDEPTCPGPLLMSGTGLVSQRTSGFDSGCAWICGCTPIGGSIARENWCCCGTFLSAGLSSSRM